MSHVLRRARGWVAAVVFCACASTTQTLEVRPEVHAGAAVEGAGRSVAVEVQDQRGAPLAPRSPDEPEIEIAPGVEDSVRRAVVRGLTQLGFAVTEAGSTRRLRVEIHDASCTTETGAPTMWVHTRAAIRVVVENGRNTRENTYRSQKDSRVVLLPSSTQNEEQLNFVVNQVLGQLFDDTALLSGLTQ